MADTDPITPIVVDLGKQSRKRIKKLKRGQGPLVGEIHDVVHQVADQLGAAQQDKQIVPVVVLYRRKPKKRSASSLFPLLP